MIKIQKLSFRIWLSEFICYLALDNWNSLVRNTRIGRLYPEVTVAFLPSSLRMIHSFPLGFSPHPPVSVYGTGSTQIILGAFLVGLLCRICSLRNIFAALGFALRRQADLPTCHPYATNAKPLRRPAY